MKSLLSILFTLVSAAMPLTASAAGSGWYLYVWDVNANAAATTSGQEFQTTSTDNVYTIESFVISSDQATNGLKLTIYDSGWSTQYGWTSSATGSITSTGATAAVGSGGSNTWCQLPEGTYDITFNYAELTIQFNEHSGGTSTAKKVSILGDSYSTMEGSLTPSTNAYWYTLGENQWHTTDVTTVEQTWWYQFINSGNYVLEYNNSYSGSTMVNTPLENMDVSTSFINRANNLGSPDIIFVFGGTNDTWNSALTMGDYQYSGWTDDDKKQFRPGFAYLINYIKTTYPSAEVYFILNDILSEEINMSITTICDYYNVPCIVTKGVDKSDYHPSAAGMTTIANQVKAVVESANDEGDTWFITGEFNSWATTQTFTQSATNSDVFVLENFSVSSSSLDAYNGFTFQITSDEWAKTYTYNATISASGVYALDDKTSDGAWSTAYCTAMTADTPYRLTWNKRTHCLTIALADNNQSSNPVSGTVVNDGSITYTTYSDGHALAVADDYLRGGDISMLNYVEDLGAKFYDAGNNEKDPLLIMKENGVNVVRLRLYNNPGTAVSYYTGSGKSKTTYNYKLPEGYLDEDDILDLALRAKAHNMKIVLTFHYSDFWTNGAMQIKPSGWESYNMTQLKQAVYDYTYNFLQRMNAQGTTPDYVALGNEIQGGLLFGYYDSSVNNQQQIDNVSGYASSSNIANTAALLNQGSAAVRAACPDAKVVIHLTLSTSITSDTYEWFFDAMKNNNLDYDVIGTSYYPYWTNSDPSTVNTLANTMYTKYSKPTLLMETGYSWTQYRPSGRYDGNYEGQLSLNGTAYNEATEAGQKSFIQELQTVVKSNSHILGYLYWDPVMVEQEVNNSWIETTWALKKYNNNYISDGNLVGNTTWFDYNGQALDVFEAIAEDAVSVPATKTINGYAYTVEQQEPYTLTMSQLGYATFYDADARTIPEGLTAYTATQKSATSLTLNEITANNIPAATGVLLQGDQGTYYLWPRYEDNSSISGNLLKGTQQQQTIVAETGSNYYYKLANGTDGQGTGGLGWYWGAANGGVFTNGANKAYLVLPQSFAGSRNFISLFGDEMTGVATVNPEPLTVNQCYNLSGQRVSNPAKGLYIVNGRKVLVTDKR